MSFRDSYVEVDLSSITENIRIIKNHTQKDFIAVIKANGYGLGDYEVANCALRAGAIYLAVSSLDEAMSLRTKGITAPILILGYVDKQYMDMVRKYDITLSTISLDWTKSVCNDIKGIKIHIKVNTGMNRIGLNDVEEVKSAMKLLEQADIEGIYTHYACADNAEHPLNNTQYLRFKSIVDALACSFKYVHISNTDGACRLKDDLCNCVRVGIGMFGYGHHDIGLIPAIKLKTRVINVQRLDAYQSVGYGAEYQTTADSWILTVPIGYADGWNTQNKDRDVYVDGEYAQIVGRICMDQMMIKTQKEYPVLQEIELFGDHISLESVAEHLKSSTYEVLVLLSERLAKKYYENNKVVFERAPRFER